MVTFILFLFLKKALFCKIIHENSRKFHDQHQSRESNVSWNVLLHVFVNREVKPCEKSSSNVKFLWQTIHDPSLLNSPYWDWHLYFWHFLVAFENFFVKAYSTLVSGAFWRSHQCLAACLRWFCYCQWLLSNNTKFKALPTAGFWPLLRLTACWQKHWIEFWCPSKRHLILNVIWS